MTVDLNDPKMAGYKTLEEIIAEDSDASSSFRDCGNGKHREVINILTTTLTFGSLASGSTSAPQSVVLANVGYEAVNIVDILVAGDFALGTLPFTMPTADAPVKILAGEFLSFPVVFTPHRVAAVIGGVYINSGDAAGPEFVKLTGTGI